MQYERLGTVPINNVIPYVILDANKLPNVADRGKLLTKDYDGYDIKMNTRNLQLFTLKGTKCAECGLKGDYFAIETQTDGHYCLNLYSKDNILFTKDHIIPKAAGGSNALENLQPMCLTCNGEKADSVDNGSYIKGAFKNEQVPKSELTPKSYRICSEKAQRTTKQTGRPLHITRIRSDDNGDDSG